VIRRLRDFLFGIPPAYEIRLHLLALSLFPPPFAKAMRKHVEVMQELTVRITAATSEMERALRPVLRAFGQFPR
jgi:hypothetical protein